MLKSSPIFKRNGAHLVGKKTFEKKQSCPLLMFECFEHVILLYFLTNVGHVNFTIIENCSKIIYENLNYYASLVIFQKYKNAISLGWLF
jgi:hypothetical protein